MTKIGSRGAKLNARTVLAKIRGGQTTEHFAKDRVVFHQGDPADAVFYIEKGKVKMTVVSEQGKEAVVAFMSADDFIGEACLAGQTQRISTATAANQPRSGRCATPAASAACADGAVDLPARPLRARRRGGRQAARHGRP